MFYLVKLFIKICFLKASPKDVPYSYILLFILIFLLFVTKNIANLAFVDVVEQQIEIAQLSETEDDKNISELRNIDFSKFNIFVSSITVLVSIVIMWGFLFGLLSYYNMQNRLVQSMTSMLAIDIILALLFLLWIFLLQLTPIALFVFVLLLYWQFVITIFIILKSADLSIIKAGLISLLYLFIQHNVAESVIKSFI